MKSGNIFIESLIVGGGTFIFLVLLFYFIFEIDSSSLEEFSDYMEWRTYGWLFVIPTVGVLSILGIITEHLSFVLFWFWENSLRKSIQPIGSEPGMPRNTKFFYELRAYLFTSDNAFELARVQNFLRSKIRITRGWCLNALLILSILIYRELSLDTFEPLIVPSIIIVGLIFMGTLFSWYMLVIHELKWLEGFNETLLR